MHLRAQDNEAGYRSEFRNDRWDFNEPNCTALCDKDLATTFIAAHRRYKTVRMDYSVREIGICHSACYDLHIQESPWY